MKKHTMPDMKEGNVNVTPLIDIVMCLIIFYMLVAKIGVDTGIVRDFILPQSTVGLPIDDPGNAVTLNVSAPLGGGFEPMVRALNPATSQLEIFPITNGALETFLKRLRGKNEEFKVILRADQSLEYRFIEPVLLACRTVKVKDYNFETEKKMELVPEGQP